MISCTEFIPLYSEFFKFLEEKGGHDAVVKYWRYISGNSIGDTSNPYSLISFMQWEGGLDSAWSYWKRVVEEEACDVLHTELTEDTLTITIEKSPAIAFSE